VFRIRASRPEDGDRTVNIWRSAVDATHHFLTPEDRHAIDEEVQRFLPQLPLWLTVDDSDRAVAFMSLTGSHMGGLFIDAAFHGVGVGRMLVEHARALHPVVTTDVNEQNQQAIGFYERLGFVRTGRSPCDDEGRAYPLIHLRLDPAG
jgi:putative acetyltransferase